MHPPGAPFVAQRRLSNGDGHVAAIGVAGAATTKKATPSPSATAGAGVGHTPVGDHAGRGGHGRGGGDIAEALADLTKASASDIMAQRASGTGFAAIAEARGVTTEALFTEATRLETAELDAAVKAGDKTDAQRTQELSTLQAHLQEELTKTHALQGDRGRGCDGITGTTSANGPRCPHGPRRRPTTASRTITRAPARQAPANTSITRRKPAV